MRWRLYIAIVLLLMVLTFVLQNTEKVQFQLLFWQFGLPRALLLLVVFLTGVVTGLLLVLSRKTSRRPLPQSKEPPSNDLQGGKDN